MCFVLFLFLFLTDRHYVIPAEQRQMYGFIFWFLDSQSRLLAFCFSFRQSWQYWRYHLFSLRILYMPPVYAVISFLSYRFFRSYTYYELVEVGEPLRFSPPITLHNSHLELGCLHAVLHVALSLNLSANSNRDAESLMLIVDLHLLFSLWSTWFWLDVAAVLWASG